MRNIAKKLTTAIVMGSLVAGCSEQPDRTTVQMPESEQFTSQPAEQPPELPPASEQPLQAEVPAQDAVARALPAEAQVVSEQSVTAKEAKEMVAEAAEVPVAAGVPVADSIPVSIPAPAPVPATVAEVAKVPAKIDEPVIAAAPAETEPEPAPESSPTPAVAAAPTAPDGVVASGTWIKKRRDSSGTWSIVRDNGALFVELDSDFKTRNAPDLKLFLSPLSAAEVTKSNAVEGSLMISLLKSNKGAQRYAIPAGNSLEQYQSILIHCEDYSVLWSAADL